MTMTKQELKQELLRMAEEHSQKERAVTTDWLKGINSGAAYAYKVAAELLDNMK